MNQIEIRLGRLERENRWLKRLGMAAVGMALLVVAAGAEKTPAEPAIQEVVKARKFVLVKDKTDVAVLECDDVNPTFWLTHGTKDNGIKITATKDGGAIYLISEFEKTPRSGLSIYASDRGAGYRIDRNDKQVSLRIDDEPSLSFDGKQVLPK